jgi:hypothetical protein
MYKLFKKYIYLIIVLVRISGKVSQTNQGDSKNRNRVRLLIFSAIGHCVTSSFANLYRYVSIYIVYYFLFDF